jgi:FkbH-like protein
MQQAEPRIREATKSQASTISSLLAAVLDAAPLLVSENILLQSVNWKDIAPSDVARMLTSLRAAAIPLPSWLIRSLLLAGHRLPPYPAGTLRPALAALQALNGLQAPGREEGLESALQAVEQAGSIDAEELEALTRRLCELGRSTAAARLAIVHGANAPRVHRIARRAIEGYLQALPAVKVRLLGMSSSDDFAKHLVPAFGAFGYRAEVQQTAYGSAIAELMRADADTDTYVLLLDEPSLMAADWRLGLDAAAARLEERNELLFVAIERFAAEGRGPLLVNTLPAVDTPSTGFLDRLHAAGAAKLLARINARLADIAARHSSLTLIDAEVALADVPPSGRIDPKLWYYARMPYSTRASMALAQSFAIAQRAVKAVPCKVLALDLDNTLWGGIVGEDGVAALECGDDSPGNAFKAFQAECLRLKAQGMLLVALSKNAPEALNALTEHPGMLLAPDDFVATAVNWQPKADNLRRIASELELGLDSVLFLDDSPHEREAMRRFCPQVRVPEMPADVAQRPRWLRGLTETWPIRLTEEDMRRSDTYHARRRTDALRAQSASFEAYLTGLEQRLVVSAVTPAILSRVAQLHLRTNQFNLTTARFDEARLKAMLDDPARFLVVAGRALDKFGDHGIVITATVALGEGTASILSFLMSCRVIGRQVEYAFLSALLDRLRERGVDTVDATFSLTAKNGIAADFLRRAQFDEVGASGPVTRWRRSLATQPAGSPFVTVDWST